MTDFRLSPEQEAILALVEPPNDDDGRCNKLVRITAAAGTGKTTTLLHLAMRASTVGHSYITYVTFNRSAAEDGQVRLQEALRHGTTSRTRIIVDARTLHSCASTLLAKARKEESDDDENPEGSNPRFIDEAALENELQQVLHNEIEQFLRPCYRTIETRPPTRNDTTPRERSRRIESAKMSAKKQVIFFLQKTLTHFCRSAYSVEDSLGSPVDAPRRDFKRNYFPTKDYHGKSNRGEKAGFLRRDYEGKIHWYADQIYTFWNYLEQKQFHTFDVEMKRAQLKRLRMPGSILLVDECQDMDSCQIDWVLRQAKYGLHVFLVGDAAQTIYGFRGAKSENMTKIRGVTDRKLTTSWRFGPEIAQIANVVLFAKEKSPQTTEKPNRMWVPYRVTGGGRLPCTVTCDSLLQYCYSKGEKVTLIGRANVSLLVEAVQLLGLSRTREDDGDSDDLNGDVSQPSSLADSPSSISQSDGVTSSNSTEPLLVPKMHLNGKGENSGLKKWKTVIREIEFVYQLFRNQPNAMTLPPNQFPEFRGELITWDSFEHRVEDRELNKYAACLSVVNKFGDRTMEAIDLFREEVMNKAYTAEEADIILSTCHAAKGLEWDYVQVCNDFTEEIVTVNDKGPPKAVTVQSADGRPTQRRRRSTWQFDARSYTDDLNLLYVACTRAKQKLSIPDTLKTLFQDCDLLNELVLALDRSGEHPNGAARFSVLGLTEMITEEGVRELYTDICEPLRMQVGLGEDESLMGKLVDELDPVGNDTDDVAVVEETTSS